jgi:hypothetical protein
MAMVGYKNGQTSIVKRFKLRDSSSTVGAGLTGLTFSSTGLVISTIADNEATPTSYTVAGSTIETITTLGTYAAPTATKCRFKEVDATKHPGVYEIQIADARWAVSGAKSIIISISGATNLVQVDAEIGLTGFDPYDAVAAGLSRIDAAISSRMATFTLPANFSSLVIDSTGRVNAFLIGILTSVFTEGAVGRIAGGFKQFFNIASPAATMDHGVLVDTVTTTTTASALTTNNDKTGYALTSGERTAIANEVEAQIIDETDSEKVLTAITDKIAAVNPSLAGLTLSAIAAQVRTELTVELARIDAAISSRSTYAGADTAGTTTLLARLTAIRAALLDHLDADITSRLAAGSYTAPDNSSIAAIKLKTDGLPNDPASTTNVTAAVTALVSAIDALNDIDSSAVLAQVNAALTTTVADSVPVLGSRPSVAQGIYILTQFLTNRDVIGTTMTVRKPDGTTALVTVTLDSATAPTAIERAS